MKTPEEYVEMSSGVDLNVNYSVYPLSMIVIQENHAGQGILHPGTTLNQVLRQ